MLSDILDQSLIQVSEEELNWREAITLAAQPLLDQRYIEERYIEAMIDTVEEFGAYIVLAPKTAVPHARPETGVLKTGISLLKTEYPVDFNVEDEEDPDRFVQLIFVLAAEDSEGHLDTLVKLSQVLEEEKIEELIDTKTKEQLIKKINNYMKE